MEERKRLAELLIEKEDLTGADLYLWGTGNTTMLYLEGLNRLKTEGFRITAFTDNNSDKWGKTISVGDDEIGVIAPKDIPREGSLVLIVSPQPRVIKSVSEQAESMGLKWRHIDSYILKMHREEVLKCFDLFEDERSKKVYSKLVQCRIEGTYPDDEYVDRDQYFSFGCFADYDPNEVFVDCGAFVGDTAETYIWRKDGAFKKIIAFEPDNENVKAFMARMERLKREWNLSDDKVEMLPYGVGDMSKVSYVKRYQANNGFGSKMVERGAGNEDGVKVVALDDVVQERYHFLKADIESYEYKMLLGAQRTIKAYSPRLAICIYHNACDFYQIPLLIAGLNPEYRFALRHYTHMLSESVLYAYL